MAINPIDPKENYDLGGISTRDFITKKQLTYNLGCAIKYIVRHFFKNGKEDLLKAKNCIEYEIENYDEIYGGK